MIRFAQPSFDGAPEQESPFSGLIRSNCTARGRVCKTMPATVVKKRGDGGVYVLTEETQNGWLARLGALVMLLVLPLVVVPTLLPLIMLMVLIAHEADALRLW